MVRKNEDFSKARIMVFYLPTKPDEVYIQSTIQPKDGPVISSLNQKRVAYLNRVALDEKRKEPRLDALANIFAGYDYKYYAVEYPCASRQMMYREVERMYARLSAEQMERKTSTLAEDTERRTWKKRMHGSEPGYTRITPATLHVVENCTTHHVASRTTRPNQRWSQRYRSLSRRRRCRCLLISTEHVATSVGTSS